jgi:hypothetical protein
MRSREASIVTAALLMALLSLPPVDQAAAMSFGHHHGDGGGANRGSGPNVQSTSGSIDAQAYVAPVPEPSTILLLGSGLAAVGLWRLKRKP